MYRVSKTEVLTATQKCLYKCLYVKSHCTVCLERHKLMEAEIAGRKSGRRMCFHLNQFDAVGASVCYVARTTTFERNNVQNEENRSEQGLHIVFFFQKCNSIGSQGFAI